MNVMTRRMTSSLLVGVAFAVAACGPSTTQQARGDEAVRPGGGSADTPAVAPTPAPRAGEIIKNRVYTRAIRSKAEFVAYSEQVADERFTKLIVDLRTDEIYYFDVNIYPVHTDFVFAEIYKEPESPEKLADFLANYDEDKPEFLLLYLVHHMAQDLWTFAFWEGDRMRPEHVAHAYERLKKTFFAAKELKFRPDSLAHRDAANALAGRVPTITNDEIYTQTNYQIFNEGSRVGVLRLIEDIPEDQLADLTYRPEEIIVVAEAIPTLSVVSGIIAEEFSTPLSHLGLRARAWGIPHIGLHNASDIFRALDGKTVYFQAGGKSYTVREATEQEIAEWEATRNQKRSVQIPPANLQATALKSLTQLRMSDTSAYGAKASNLGEIVDARLDGFSVPPGFALPISYYLAHMKKHGLQVRAMANLTGDRFRSDPEHRRNELAALREAIVAAPMDKALLSAIVDKAKALRMWGPGRGVFVRSSTNAEDLPGFNGAGLYDTVPNVKGEEALEAAVKTVWASVWNVRAYEEREFFGIDHRAVYGAVLVQAGVDATAAGVLITTNVFAKDERTTYTINAKSGLGIRVVEGRKVPEQILFDWMNRHIRVLSRSDEDTMLVFDGDGGVKEVPVPEKGEPVLTDDRAQRLVDAARAIVEVFPKDAPQDIEWLFEGEQLHIVQSRPYVTD